MFDTRTDLDDAEGLILGDGIITFNDASMSILRCHLSRRGCRIEILITTMKEE